MARFGAQGFVVFALFTAFRVDGFKFLPGLTPLALLAVALPVLLLAPTQITAKLPVSLSVLLLLTWELASVMWTASPQGTGYTLELDAPLVIGMFLIAGVLALDDLVRALLWSMRFSFVFTGLAIAADPLARTHIDPAGLQAPLEGWHGYFPHKNVMGPYLVFCLVTILAFDRTKVLRPLSLVAIGILIVGSDSVTGISGMLLALSIWIWVQLYRNLEIRNSSIFVVSSVLVLIFGVLGAATSLTAITDASGKDLTFTGRTFIWQATFNAWMQRPVVGYGLGGVLGSNPITSKTAEIWRAIGFRVPHSHNGVLDVGLQLGIIGVALYLLLWGTTLAGGFRLLRERPRLASWIVTVMLVQLYMSLSEPVFLNNGWLPVLVMFRVLLLRKEGIDGGDIGDSKSSASRLRHAPGLSRMPRPTSREGARRPVMTR
jgi:O-antigen ligase